MPKFVDVEWNTPIKKFYNAKASSDKLMIAVKEKALIPANKTMKKNHQDWTDEVSKVKTAAKKMMVDVLDHKSKIEAGEDTKQVEKSLSTIKGRAAYIKALSVELGKTNKEYAEAFNADGYRQMNLLSPMEKLGYFKIVDKKLFEKTYKKLLSARTPVIAKDRANLGERKRVDEYADRAAIIYKSCISESKSILAKAKDFDSRMKALDASVMDRNEDVRRIKEKIESLTNGARNNKIPRDKVELMLDAAYSDLLSQRKNLAGKIKTMITELDALSKAYGKTAGRIKQLKKTLVQIKGIKAEEAQLKKGLANFDKAIAKLLDKTHA